MTPYYADDLVTIYHGDCREVMAAWMVIPPESFDAIVTDPPYGIGARTANRARGRSRIARANDWPSVVGDNQPFDPSWLLAEGKPTILWGANHYADRLPASPTWLVWDKRVGLPSNDSADCELAWTNLGGPARLMSHRWMGMLRDSEKAEAYHPTQKPVALMLWALRRVPSGTVLDPFCGSGSTLVAAKQLGRKAIGIEIEERCCEIAATRCAQEVLGLSA